MSHTNVKRKIKLLVVFLVSIVFLTFGMSGLYVDIFDSARDWFGGGKREDIMIVQKVSAYSAQSLSSAIESIGSVNILELKLENDIDYSGDVLEAGKLTARGTSTLYLDVNGHKLSISNEEGGGMSLPESTFYGVDTVGTGEIDIYSNGTGLECKNFVFSEGTLTINVKPEEDTEGPFPQSGFINGGVDVSGIIESSGVDVDSVGYDITSNYTKGVSSGDALRVDDVCIIGRDAYNVNNPCTVTLNGGGNLASDSMFAMQRTNCGLKVGYGDSVNDGTIIIKNKCDANTKVQYPPQGGGHVVCTGAMGMFANVIRVEGGLLKALGSCGSAGADQTGIFFSDSEGLDGYLLIDTNATVFASTLKNTASIFSWCCSNVTIKGQLYAGCTKGHVKRDGNIDMARITDVNFFGGGLTYDQGSYKNGIPSGGIAVDIGDIIIEGTSARVFALGHSKVIMAGQDPDAGGWDDDKTDVWLDGNAVNAKQYSYTGWITPGVYENHILKKNPSLNNLKMDELRYRLTHAGSLTIINGAMVFSRSYKTGPVSHFKSFSIACSGGDGTESEDDFGVKIEGTNQNQTRVYLLADEEAIHLEHVSMRASGNVYISADTNYAPANQNFTFCFNGEAMKWTNTQRGGKLVVQRGAVMDCVGKAGNGYVIGLSVSIYMSIKHGGTLRVNVASNDKRKSLGAVVWGNTYIEDGAAVQMIADATGLRAEGGEININGNNTYSSFTSRGGQFGTDEVWFGRSHLGCISMKGTSPLNISGGATVECSFVDDKNRSDAAIHVHGTVNIYDSATVKCSNSLVGIRSGNNINVSGSATVDIRNVKYGLQSTFIDHQEHPGSSREASIFITGGANVNIQSEQDAIHSRYKVEIKGSPRVSLKNSYPLDHKTGTGIWVEVGDANKDAILIDLESGGRVSVHAPGAVYGISAANGNIVIKGKGRVISEAGDAGLRGFGNITLNAGESAQYRFYGKEGYGIITEKVINISGEGELSSSGYRHGIFAGTKDDNHDVTASTGGKVYITGNVKVTANGNIATSSGISQSAVTSGFSIPKYNSLEEIALANGGGFYATISNTVRGSIVAAVGSSSSDGGDRSTVVNRMNATGGPEEIWYFKYESTDEKGRKGTWTIQNYMTKKYMYINGSMANGSKIGTNATADLNKSYFMIRKSKYRSSEGDYTVGKENSSSKNEFVIFSGYVGGSYNTNGVYGTDYGKFCLDAQGSLGEEVNGDFGTQVNDNIYMQIWSNDDAVPKYNYNQIFQIDPIVEFGDFFTANIKSVEKNQYINFNPGTTTVHSAYNWVSTKTNFNFNRDLTGIFPFSYEISENGSGSDRLRFDVSGGGRAEGTKVGQYTDNNSISQRFRIVYSIGHASYGIKSVVAPWMIGVVGNEMVLKRSGYASSMQFVLEDLCANVAGLIKDGKAEREVLYPTQNFGKTVTIKLVLSTGNVDKFILRTAGDFSRNVHPKKWSLYEGSVADANLVYERAQSATSMFGNSYEISFKPKNTSNTVYYLVLKAQDNAQYVSIGDIAFYSPTTGGANSSGISASERVEITLSNKGYVNAKGQMYGIRCATNIAINGTSTSDGTGITKVEAIGVGSQGKGIHAGANITTSNCTVIAKGKALGIGIAPIHGGNYVDSTFTIGDNSTIDAFSENKTDFGIKINEASPKNKIIKISPSASVRTSGKSVANNGSISPQPISSISGEAVYEVQFHYSTIGTNGVKTDNATIDVTKRHYGETLFTTHIYSNNKVPFTTVATNYTEISKRYLGVGHDDGTNEHSLYIYLPNGKYINTVEAYDYKANDAGDIKIGTKQYYVNYTVAGYNKIDENGELMFTAKYNMGDYNSYSANHIATANVESKRVDAFPLLSFSLETYRIYQGSKGKEISLTPEQVMEIKTAVSSYDGDTNYTWSEVKYYLEHFASGTVYVKVAKNSLAFSTIKVKDGVDVIMYADSSVMLYRAVLDDLLGKDMDDMYETPPTGTYPVEGESGDTMISGFDKIKIFYKPSKEAFTSANGYPVISTQNNGLTLPLFHLEGDSDLTIEANIDFDNIGISSKHVH